MSITADNAAPGAAASREWHLSPLADMAFYHWSWLVFFAPLALSGDKHWSDYAAIWIAGSVISFAHRHLTIPYVYLDGQITRQFLPRFIWAPILLGLGFAVTPALDAATLPAGFLTASDAVVAALVGLVGAIAFFEDRRGHRFSGRAVGLAAALAVIGVGATWAGCVQADHRVLSALAAVALGAAGAALTLEASETGVARSGLRRYGGAVASVALAAAAVGLAPAGRALGPPRDLDLSVAFAGIAAVALVWNVWHVYMQKYGILRMYAAKSRAPAHAKTPPLVDRWLVFGWLPLYFVWLGAHSRALVEKFADDIFPYLRPIIDGVQLVYPVALPLGIACAAASMGTWAWYEWRATRFSNAPRLSMALGTSLLGAAVLWSPVKGYLAFGFGHAVEYTAFVWAYQRRRYAAPLPHDPVLGRLMRHPWLAYGAFFAVVGGGCLVFQFGKYFHWLDPHFAPAGTTPGMWLYYWTVWSSMSHFWFDSFLWKMRQPQVRATVAAAS
jgi:hypothetical protein